MSKEEHRGTVPADHVGDALPPASPSPWPTFHGPGRVAPARDALGAAVTGLDDDLREAVRKGFVTLFDARCVMADRAGEVSQ